MMIAAASFSFLWVMKTCGGKELVWMVEGEMCCFAFCFVLVFVCWAAAAVLLLGCFFWLF